LSLVEIISRSGLRSDCGSFLKLPGPPRGPGFGMTGASLACARPPQGGPIGRSTPHAPLEGSFHVWPWGSLDTPPRGLSHATPLGGCCVTVRDPSPAHAGGSCLPCQGGFPHTIGFQSSAHSTLEEKPPSIETPRAPPALDWRGPTPCGESNGGCVWAICAARLRCVIISATLGTGVPLALCLGASCASRPHAASSKFVVPDFGSASSAIALAALSERAAPGFLTAGQVSRCDPSDLCLQEYRCWQAVLRGREESSSYPPCG